MTKFDQKKQVKARLHRGPNVEVENFFVGWYKKQYIYMHFLLTCDAKMLHCVVVEMRCCACHYDMLNLSGNKFQCCRLNKFVAKSRTLLKSKIRMQ